MTAAAPSSVVEEAVVIAEEAAAPSLDGIDAADVHEAAAPLQTREGIRAQLVVAACGPTTLVKAAENAVMTVKGAIDSEHVRVQFSPVDWHS